MTWTTILIAAISGALGGLTYSIISDRIHERRCQQEEERVRWYYKCDWCGAGFGCYPQDWDACMAQHEATCARQVPEEEAALLDHYLDQRQPPSPRATNTQTPNTEEHNEHS